MRERSDACACDLTCAGCARDGGAVDVRQDRTIDVAISAVVQIRAQVDARVFTQFACAHAGDARVNSTKIANT